MNCPRCDSAGPMKKDRNICKACDSRRAVEWARKNRQKKRDANNRHHKKISSKRAAQTARWRQRHPLAYKAHIAVNSALRSGSLLRQSCCICGAKGHAHHDDYSKPLDIIWLCHSHHMERHAMLAERSKQ